MGKPKASRRPSPPFRFIWGRSCHLLGIWPSFDEPISCTQSARLLPLLTYATRMPLSHLMSSRGGTGWSLGGGQPQSSNPAAPPAGLVSGELTSLIAQLGRFASPLANGAVAPAPPLAAQGAQCSAFHPFRHEPASLTPQLEAVCFWSQVRGGGSPPMRKVPFVRRFAPALPLHGCLAVISRAQTLASGRSLRASWVQPLGDR